MIRASHTFVFGLLIGLSLGGTAFGQYSAEEFDALTKTTVYASADSPTGYMVTFRYVNADAKEVQIRGEWSFSDIEHATMYTSGKIPPTQWHDGLFVLGPWPTVDMEKNASGTWIYTIPLPSGTFNYSFRVDGEKVLDANALTYANEWAREDLAASQVYVPFDARFQSDDRSVEMPRVSNDRGSMEYVKFPSAEGRMDPIGVYLPSGYDPSREQPYRLLVLIHGGNGNYTDWPNQGSAVNILDNLIGDEEVEPLIMVSVTNHGDIFSRQVAEDYLLPYLEAHYNVSTDPADRALGGLSRGGFWTSNFLFANPGNYQYYLIMSSGILTEDRYNLKAPLDANWDYGEENLAAVRSRYILVSTGLQDNLLPYVLEMHKRFAEKEIPFTNYHVEGGHQWDNWRQVLTYSLRHFLWK